MFIRKMSDKDFGDVRKILSVCFETPNNNTNDEELNRIKNDKSMRSRNYFNRYLAFDDNGNLTSTIQVIPYKSFFDNQSVNVSGIGGVASLPQYRNKGAVRQCFSTAFSEMYEEEYAFSYLYGFSTSYYKKFGYCLACDVNEWEVKIHRIYPCNTKGSYELISGDISGLKEVYSEMCKRYSLVVDREEDDWNLYSEKDYIKDNSYTYLYRDEKGVPKSFFTYKRVANGWENIMDMGENVYFYDKEGFGAILDFAINMKGNFHVLKMAFPADAKVDTILEEHAYSAITKKYRSNGMARCINLQTVLQKTAFCGSGEIILKINDDMISQNNGTWKIVFENNCLSSIEKTMEKPFAEMSIDIFTAMILGRYDIKDAEYISGLDVYSSDDELAKIFYKRKLAIYDHF